MPDVRVSILKHEDAKKPWIETIHPYTNSFYKFIQRGPETKPELVASWKPGSRIPAPRPMRNVRAKMLKVAIAIGRGRYMRLGLIETPAKPPKLQTELFPEDVAASSPRSPKEPLHRRILATLRRVSRSSPESRSPAPQKLLSGHPTTRDSKYPSFHQLRSFANGTRPS